MYHVVYYYVYPSVGYFISDAVILNYANREAKKNILNILAQSVRDRYSEIKVTEANVKIMTTVDEWEIIERRKSILKIILFSRMKFLFLFNGILLKCAIKVVFNVIWVQSNLKE